MKIRLLAFLAILVLVAGIVPVAAAQNNPDPQKLNCLNLSTDDCAIVQASLDNINNMNSFSLTMSVTEALAGAEAIAPGMGLDSSTDLKGSGAVVIDHAAMTSDAPYNGVSMSFDVTGNSSSNGTAQPVDTSFVLVDGVVYFKDDSGAWKGVAIDDMMKHPEVMQGLMASIPGTSMMGMSLPPEMLNGMMGDMGQFGGTSAQGAMGNLNLGGLDPMTLLDIPGFISQKRLADEDMMGQTMQVFAYTGDIGTLLQSSDLQQALTDAMSGGAASGAPSGGMGGQMAMMIPALLQSTTGTMTVTRWIGADDQFMHQVSLVVDAQIDLFGGAPASSKVTPIPPITLKLDATFGLDKINDTAAPTAPEGATIVSAADLVPTTEGTPEATPAQ